MEIAFAAIPARVTSVIFYEPFIQQIFNEVRAKLSKSPQVMNQSTMLDTSSPNTQGNPEADETELDEDETENNTLASPTPAPRNISMQILSGFMAVAGGAAVAIAFTLLHAATFGAAGLVVAALGTASLLAGVGLFASGTCKNRQAMFNDSLDAAVTPAV